MSDSNKKQLRHARSEDSERVDDNTSAPRRRRTKESKGKRKFKPIYIIPIVFVVCCLGFAYYMFSSLNTKGPVYGQRCSSGMTLDLSKMTEAQEKISQTEGLSSVKISTDCLIIKMEFKFNDDVALEDAKQMVIDATHVFDETMGYPKNSEEDTYSKMLSVDGDRRQYDLEIVLYGGQEGFPAYGTKQYRNNEITFTDANAKDQALADSVVAGQNNE